MQTEHFICRKELGLHPWILVKGTLTMWDCISLFVSFSNIRVQCLWLCWFLLSCFSFHFHIRIKKRINPIGVTLQHDYPLEANTLDSYNEIMVNEDKKQLSYGWLQCTNVKHTTSQDVFVCFFTPFQFYKCKEMVHVNWFLPHLNFRYASVERNIIHVAFVALLVPLSTRAHFHTLQWTST